MMLIHVLAFWHGIRIKVLMRCGMISDFVMNIPYIFKFGHMNVLHLHNEFTEWTYIFGIDVVDKD